MKIYTGSRNVLFQKKSIPSLWKLGHRKFLGRQCLKINWNFLGEGGGGGGVQNKKPSMGRVWIFRGIAQYKMWPFKCLAKSQYFRPLINKAQNNGQSSDNVQPDWGFEQSNVYLAGHIVWR